MRNTSSSQAFIAPLALGAVSVMAAWLVAQAPGTPPRPLSLSDLAMSVQILNGALINPDEAGLSDDVSSTPLPTPSLESDSAPAPTPCPPTIRIEATGPGAHTSIHCTYSTGGSVHSSTSVNATSNSSQSATGGSVSNSNQSSTSITITNN